MAIKVSHWRHMPSLSAERPGVSPVQAVAFAVPRSVRKAWRVEGSQCAKAGTVGTQS